MKPFPQYIDVNLSKNSGSKPQSSRKPTETLLNLTLTKKLIDEPLGGLDLQSEEGGQTDVGTQPG